jgi:hypothetical protein
MVSLLRYAPVGLSGPSLSLERSRNNGRVYLEAKSLVQEMDHLLSKNIKLFL